MHIYKTYTAEDDLMTNKLTQKELTELKRLDRKLLNGRPVTRKQVMRAFDLRRRKHATAEAA